RTKIISAGETLMMRDIDPLRLVHTFGMVDIYVQGSKQTTITENFGFTFGTIKDEQALIQSAALFHFRTQNDDVTIEKPIYDVLEVTNVSKSASYDITGFTIIGNGQVINLNETLSANTTIGLDPSDIIQVSYRYRDSEPYIFIQQPAEAIVSVVGEISGTLSTDNYILQKLEDPLQFGNSTSAHDQMKLIFANGVPTGDVLSITDESILLFAENESSLSRFGIDVDTIVVTDNQNLITYIKDIDYIVTEGTSNTSTTIKRTPTSTIPSGDSVFVDYTSGENITVSYNVNSLLTDVQNRIEIMRHLTADVVVKGAIKTFIDIDMKVVVEEGGDQTSIDRNIRTAVARLFSAKQIGESIYQSDVIKVVEGINGVVHQVVPYTRMVKSNDSYSMRESYNGSFDTFQTVNVTSYRSVGTLSWETTAGGGSDNLFVGVFENDIPLAMVDNISEVAELSGRAYIDGDGHLYISPKLGPIGDATITTTYVIQDAQGSRDIIFSDIEYGAVGTITITFDFIPKFKGF
ncbi:baseplate J/gp47 family protein, partial [bacterium]|nr:baseplate J/gp47 family protein [bacterium]